MRDLLAAKSQQRAPAVAFTMVRSRLSRQGAENAQRLSERKSATDRGTESAIEAQTGSDLTSASRVNSVRTSNNKDKRNISSKTLPRTYAWLRPNANCYAGRMQVAASNEPADGANGEPKELLARQTSSEAKATD
jgi:hypothetical protein